MLEITGKPNKDLTCNKVAVYNLGFDRGTDIKSHWIYFPGEEVFYRVGFYNNILGSERMSLYVEIGLRSEDSFDPPELLEVVMNDLKKCGIITEHELVDYQSIVMNPAYVHITKDSKTAYLEWCDSNNPEGIYSIGRYGSWTYCSIEDNVIEAKKLSEKIK
jgi:protoporphyrinogen oxidase